MGSPPSSPPPYAPPLPPPPITSHRPVEQTLYRWHGQSRRRRIGVAVIVVGVVIVAIVATFELVSQRGFAERATVVLSATQSPPYLAAYCVPDGTLVHFAWQTSDASSIRLQVWSTSLLIGSEYDQFAAAGNGAFYFYAPDYFSAGNETSSLVQVNVNLSFSVNGSYLSGTPFFGPC